MLRGNVATHHRSARTQSIQRHTSRNVHILIFYLTKNGPPPYLLKQTGMIRIALSSPLAKLIPHSSLLTVKRYTSKLVRYILSHKMRYISLCSMRYDINPYKSCAERHISHRRYIASSDISQIRQDLYRCGFATHSALRIPNSELKNIFTYLLTLKIFMRNPLIINNHIPSRCVFLWN